MQSDRKKELKQQYKETPIAMGVFQIKNTLNGKIFVGSSKDVESIMRRTRSELKFGSHRNKALLADWKEFGEDKFSFDVLESFLPKEADKDYTKDLKALEELYLEKFEPYEPAGYMDKKA